MKKKGRKKRARILNRVILAIGIACFAYYLLMGLAVNFGQSLLWVWPLAGVACIARYFLFRHGTPKIPRLLLRTARCLILAALAVLLALSVVVLTGCFRTAPQGLDCVIVLGAKVNGTQPSGALRNRIQLASEYLGENPDTIAVASGGQGEDEDISEAQCIFEGLVQRGIAENRILLEDRSTSTAENLEFSLALLGDDVRTVGIATNNFHVYRALRTANTIGGRDFYGLPVATSLMSFPHYLLREAVALGAYFALGVL